MKTVNIKGKEYVMVNERLAYFRENYKGYSLESELVSIEGDSCIIKATIKDEAGKIIATGHAHEDATDGYINKTSHIENCETSAWGRALANLGIGLDASVASAEEVQGAIAKQEVIKDQEKKQKLMSQDDLKANLEIVMLVKKELPNLGDRLDNYGWHKFEPHALYSQHVKDKLYGYIQSKLDSKFLFSFDGADNEIQALIDVIKEKEV